MFPMQALSTPGAPARMPGAAAGYPSCVLVEGGTDGPGGGRLGCLFSCMSEEAEELERARQGGPAVRMDSFLGTVATKPFPSFSRAASVPSWSVMKTCN